MMPNVQAALMEIRKQQAAASSDRSEAEDSTAVLQLLGVAKTLLANVSALLLISNNAFQRHLFIYFASDINCGIESMIHQGLLCAVLYPVDLVCALTSWPLQVLSADVNA